MYTSRKTLLPSCIGVKNLNTSTNRFTSFSSKEKRIIHKQVFLKRSTFEKKLVFTLVVVFGLLVIMILSVIIDTDKPPGFCTTESCILTAARVLSVMNTSVDPCHDFYEYACGRYTDINFYPFDEESDLINDHLRQMEYRLRRILEDDSPDIEPMHRARTLYKMCMDTDRLNRQGLEPLSDILDALELPRALPNDADAKNFNLVRSLALIKRFLNLDILIEVSIEYDYITNSTVLIVEPDLGNLVIGKDELFVEEERLVFQLTYIVGVLSELDTAGSYSLDDLMEEAKELHALRELLKMDTMKSDDYNEARHFVTLAQFQEYMSLNASSETSSYSEAEVPFSWQDYFTILMEDLNVTITKDFVILIDNTAYFEMLGFRLVSLKMASFQKLIWWKVVDFLGIHTTNAIRHHRRIYEEHIVAEADQRSRNMDLGILTTRFVGLILTLLWPMRSFECLENIKPLFEDLICYKLITSDKDRHWINKEVDSMVSEVRSTMTKMISNSLWIDHSTRIRNIHSLYSGETLIGYPKVLENASRIIDRYKKMEIIPFKFIRTLTNMRSYQFIFMFNAINNNTFDCRSYEEFRWHSSPLNLNMGIDLKMNTLVIPFGFLQFPFYVADVPFWNYALIGSSIGRGLTFNFDPQAYNEDGEPEAWNDKRKGEFFFRAECFVWQYNSFLVRNKMPLNGFNTLLENVADYIGLRVAYFTYEKIFREVGRELNLPGLQTFSHLQLFFLSYAHLMCEKEKEFAFQHGFDEHYSPPRFRVLGPLQNMPEFSREWNCPLNSKMNPENKCTFW